MKFLKLFKNEYFWVLIITLVALGVSIYPTLYGLRITPAGTKYSLASNYYPDYYQYVGWMKDGELGNFSTTTRFTAEKFPAKYALPYMIYPILGKIGSMTGLSLFTTYTIARVILGGIRILGIYFLIRLIFPDKKRRIFSLIITVFSVSWLRLSLTGNQLKTSFFLSGITNFDIFIRTVFVPHHLLSQIFNIFFIVYFYKALKENKTVFSAAASFFLLLSSLVNPATILN